MNSRRRVSCRLPDTGRLRLPGRDRRCGLSSLDYVLVLGVIFPLATIVIPNGKKMIQLVYEMIVVMISWPFM